MKNEKEYRVSFPLSLYLSPFFPFSFFQVLDIAFQLKIVIATEKKSGGARDLKKKHVLSPGMTIFLENREEQIRGEGTWLIGSGSTKFACKAYFAWNRVDCHVRCTIPVKGGPITPLKQWRGSVRISRFRKLTAVRFDANKNAATIQRTADGSFSSNCWPVTISFNDYSPAVSYILAYPRFIYIEQFTNSLFFFFSPPNILLW